MRYVIIGNSAAGNAAARKIIERDPSGEVVLFSDEPHQTYNRPLIPNRIDESVDEAILFRSEWDELEGVDKRLGHRVRAINAEEKTIELETGESHRYDKLLLATGGSAHRPRLPGIEAENVFALRTLNDAHKIKEAAEKAEQAVVIGAGRVGMKAATVLKKVGLDVTVVEKLGYALPLQFDQEAGEMMGTAVRGQGIALILGRTVRNILRSNGMASGLELEDGRELKAQVIVVATGVQPNINLAKEAGLRVNRGIGVDARMETSLPGIYAAGDAAEVADIVTGEPIVSGLWTNAIEMGKIAGRNMAGEEVDYDGAFGVLNALELGGIPTITMGVVNPAQQKGYDIHSHRSESQYRKLVLKEGVLVGALLMGEVEGAGVYAWLIRKKAKIQDPEALMIRGKPSFVRHLKVLPTRERNAMGYG